MMPWSAVPSAPPSWLAPLLSAVVVAFATPARAAEPASEQEVAQRIHERAIRTYEEGKRREAIELWREALGVHAHWKYAYNLANALYEVGDLAEAWASVGQTLELGAPAKHQAVVLSLRAKIRTELLKTHAYLQLEVEPADAEVLRNGAQWPVPREVWTKADHSRVVVSRQGYIAQNRVINHPLGRSVSERMVLLRQGTGTLVVAGTPAGASVRLDETPFGKLPEAGPAEVEVGPHVISVTHPGRESSRREVTIDAGETELVTVNLKAVAPPPPPPTDLETPGWVALGSGIAVAALGAGLLGWAVDVADDLNALSQDPARLAEMGYDAYHARYESDGQRIDDLQVAGWVSVGIGAAAAVAGIVLLALHEDQDEEPGPAPGVTLLLGRRQGVALDWRF